MFPGVEDALHFAFGMEPRPVLKISAAFADMRGSTVRLTDNLSVWERHVQAAFILAMVRRTLGVGEHWASLDARLTIPVDRLSRQRKESAVQGLSSYVSGEIGQGVDRWYTNDVARSWAGLRRHHPDSWWAHHTGLAETTLRKWRLGRSDSRRKGIIPMLHITYQGAISKLEIPMYRAGLVVS